MTVGLIADFFFKPARRKRMNLLVRWSLMEQHKHGDNMSSPLSYSTDRSKSQDLHTLNGRRLYKECVKTPGGGITTLKSP